jgi:hypothetical protein
VDNVSGERIQVSLTKSGDIANMLRIATLEVLCCQPGGER